MGACFPMSTHQPILCCGAQEAGRHKLVTDAATRLYDDIKAGDEMGGACRFVEFLRRVGAWERPGNPLRDTEGLMRLVRQVADSPPRQRKAMIHVIENLLPGPDRRR